MLFAKMRAARGSSEEDGVSKGSAMWINQLDRRVARSRILYHERMMPKSATRWFATVYPLELPRLTRDRSAPVPPGRRVSRRRFRGQCECGAATHEPACCDDESGSTSSVNPYRASLSGQASANTIGAG